MLQERTTRDLWLPPYTVPHGLRSGPHGGAQGYSIAFPAMNVMIADALRQLSDDDPLLPLRTIQVLRVRTCCPYNPVSYFLWNASRARIPY